MGVFRVSIRVRFAVAPASFPQVLQSDCSRKKIGNTF